MEESLLDSGADLSFKDKKCDEYKMYKDIDVLFQGSLLLQVRIAWVTEGDGAYIIRAMDGDFKCISIEEIVFKLIRQGSSSPRDLLNLYLLSNNFSFEMSEVGEMLKYEDINSVSTVPGLTVSERSLLKLCTAYEDMKFQLTKPAFKVVFNRFNTIIKSCTLYDTLCRWDAPSCSITFGRCITSVSNPNKNVDLWWKEFDEKLFGREVLEDVDYKTYTLRLLTIYPALNGISCGNITWVFSPFALDFKYSQPRTKRSKIRTMYYNRVLLERYIRSEETESFFSKRLERLLVTFNCLCPR